MTDSKRLIILKELTTLLQGITPANGYQHDLSTVDGVVRVYRGRVTFGNETDVPAINILEPLNPDREPSVTDQGRVQQDRWVLLIQGWALDDESNPTDPAHLLMADVKKRLSEICRESEHFQLPNPLYMLGGKVAAIFIEPGTVRPPDENSSRAFFFLRIVLNVVEHLGDPYKID